MTRKGVWNLQQVRDKYLQSLWVNDGQLWGWGDNNYGKVGQNTSTPGFSSPTQIDGDWSGSSVFHPGETNSAGVTVIKGDGTLWSWGYNGRGQLGHNNRTNYSSPIQVGSDTTWAHSTSGRHTLKTKTDGTLWAMGYNTYGQLGNNAGGNDKERSSPTQIPGTSWDSSTKFKISTGEANSQAIRTDGTLWSWGFNENGMLGHNNMTHYSSPVQIPGTTWTHVSGSRGSYVTAIRTDGTLWVWGRNIYGHLGLNDRTDRSSPTQIPGTNWKYIHAGQYNSIATKTDGTLWTWGANDRGNLGLNDKAPAHKSSPTQVGAGTDWNIGVMSENTGIALKTDGTLWGFGLNSAGEFGWPAISPSGSPGWRSSPIQIPGTWEAEVGITDGTVICMRNLLTPSQL